MVFYLTQRVSAIIPVRNRPHLIERAILSIQRQSSPVDEIVVVDDGSTDHTPKVVANLAAADARIKLIRLEASGGAPKARNLGVRVASGDAVAFLDSDDEWEREKIETQLRLWSETADVPAVFTNISRMHIGRPIEVTNVPRILTFENLYRGNVLGSTSTALVSRTAFWEVGGFDETLPSCQDWDLWLKLAQLGSLRCCEAALTRYHFDGHDRISSNTTSVEIGHLKVFERIATASQQKGMTGPGSAQQLNYLAEIMLFSTGNLSKALKYSMKSALRRGGTREKLKSLFLCLNCVREYMVRVKRSLVN